MSGGPGNDFLVGGAGRDLLTGDDGNDVVNGQGASGDTVSGGLGSDRLDGGDGSDVLAETGDVDVLFTALGFSGGLGSDVYAHVEVVSLTGGEGNDALFGAGGTSVDGDTAATLTGKSGADAFRSDPDGLDRLNTDAFDTVSPDLFSDFPAWVDSL